VAQLFVHERTGTNGEAREIEVRRDLRRQNELELAARDLGLPEGRLEKGIVRARRHGRGHDASSSAR